MRVDPLAYLGQELESLKEQGLYRSLRVLEGEPLPHATFDRKSVVNLSSNNYLGLTTHPALIERAIEATRQFGVGSGSVRTIVTATHTKDELQFALDKFKKVGTALGLI